MEKFKSKEENAIESNFEKKQGIFSAIEAFEKKFKLPLALASFLTLTSTTGVFAESFAESAEKSELTPQQVAELFKIPSDSIYSVEIGDKQSNSKGNILGLEGKTLSGKDISYLHVFDRKSEFRDLLTVSSTEDKDLKLVNVVNVEGIGDTREEAVANAVSNSIRTTELYISKSLLSVDSERSSFLEISELSLSAKEIFKFRIEGYSTYENPYDHGKSITAKVSVSIYFDPNKVPEKNL